MNKIFMWFYKRVHRLSFSLHHWSEKKMDALEPPVVQQELSPGALLLAGAIKKEFERARFFERWLDKQADMR